MIQNRAKRTDLRCMTGLCSFILEKQQVRSAVNHSCRGELEILNWEIDVGKTPVQAKSEGQ
jgi:hypothetical protein